MHRESGLVVAYSREPQGRVVSPRLERWLALVAEFRTNLERMRDQPKKPPFIEDPE